jgi:hypothetical protein
VPGSLLVGSGAGSRMFKSGRLVAFYFLSAEQRVFSARFLRDFWSPCVTF